MRQDMKKNDQTKITVSVLLLLLLISLLLTYAIYFINTELIKHDRIPTWQRVMVVYSFAIFAILNLYTVKNLLTSINTIKATQIYKDNIKSLDNFINILKSQRHEFNNHLQIIWGLINVGKYQDAIKYIEQISETLKNTSKFYSLGSIELSALIFAKSSLAQKLNISFEFNYNVDFSNFKYDSIDLINICGNLIDNAFYYAKASISRIVFLDINEENDYIKISVTNSGSYISETSRDKIFDLGFSTKSSTGLGLFIVKSAVLKYNGFIEVDSFYKDSQEYIAEGFTTFNVFLPKKA